MTKGVKIALIVAAGLVVLGLILAGVALLLVGGNWSRLNTAAAGELHTYDYDGAQLQDIRLKDVARDVILTASADGQVHIACYESNSAYYEINYEPTGTLELRFQSTPRRWLDSIGLSIGNSDPTLEVAIPAGFRGTLSVETASGGIRLTGLELAELSAATASGDVRLSALTVRGGITLATASGEQWLDGVTAGGEVRCSAASGDLRLEQLACAGGLRLSTASGEVLLSDAAAADCALKIDSASGEVVLSDCSFGAVDIGTVSGDVVLRALACGDLRLETTSGELYGTLRAAEGSYRVKAHTVSGDLSLPESYGDGPYTLKVETVSGDANLSLTD